MLMGDHDRFVTKNRNIARAHEVEERDRSMERKGFSRFSRQREASCFNCKSKGKCMEFRMKRSGGSKGAVSFGGDETFICDRYEPMPANRRGMSDRQIKSLLKNAKRMRL